MITKIVTWIKYRAAIIFLWVLVKLGIYKGPQG